MPRPIMRPLQKEERKENCGFIREQTGERRGQPLTQRTQMEQDRLLRKPRSKSYMDVMQHLDQGSHVQNRSQIEKLLEELRREFPEIEVEGVLLGIVSKCYLGDPYEVHSVDFAGAIVKHYKRGEPLPGALERARSLALCGSYAFVEVYLDCCRAVSLAGTVSVIR